ncbi:hypothetical protein pipiens_016968, partial [Culex pipiens pipiens]
MLILGNKSSPAEGGTGLDCSPCSRTEQPRNVRGSPDRLRQRRRLERILTSVQAHPHVGRSCQRIGTRTKGTGNVQICCQITIRTPVKENRAKTHEDRPEPKASSATIARPSLAEDQESGERRPRKTKGIACERSLFLRRLRTALICAVPEQQHGRSSHETAGTSPRGFSRAIGFVWRINSVERRGASWCQAPIARARERGQPASCARAAA